MYDGLDIIMFLHAACKNIFRLRHCIIFNEQFIHCSFSRTMFCHNGYSYGILSNICMLRSVSMKICLSFCLPCMSKMMEIT